MIYNFDLLIWVGVPTFFHVAGRLPALVMSGEWMWQAGTENETTVVVMLVCIQIT
jgi:hypothetical protein